VPRSKSPAPEPERLQKVLARLGLASRREAEEWIKSGRLTINDEVATLGVKVGPRDRVKLDGRLIHRYEPAATPVFLCHRSPGDTGELAERLPSKAGKRFIPISPMPRIDGGLELLTADGETAAKLQRAAHHVTSEFSVRIKGELTDEQRDRILEGTLDRGIRLDVDSCEAGGGEASNRWYTLVARGGSGKDVRQLFERQGALVSRIMRTRLGPLALDPRLGRGRFRELTREEISALTSAAAERRSSAP
jgi:23S rRNA pseudouridine2605 synthase